MNNVNNGQPFLRNQNQPQQGPQPLPQQILIQMPMMPIPPHIHQQIVLQQQQQFAQIQQEQLFQQQQMLQHGQIMPGRQSPPQQSPPEQNGKLGAVQPPQPIPKSTFPIYNPKKKVHVPIPSVDPVTLYQCGKELIEHCKEGKFPLKINGLKNLGRSLIYIKDEQNRNPIHIISSLGKADRITLNAIFKLAKLCPELLRMQDNYGDTPIDLLYNMVPKKKFDAILNRVSPCYFTKLSTLCYARNAELFINRYLPDYRNALSQDDLDGISEENNPGRVCYQLEKSYLIEKYILWKFQNGSHFEKLLMLGDPVSLEKYIAHNKYNGHSLKFFLNALFEMGYNEKSLEKYINDLSDQNYKSSYFSSCLQYVPSLFLRDLNSFTLPKLLDIFRNYIVDPEANLTSDVFLDVVVKLIESEVFNYNDLCSGSDNAIISRLLPYTCMVNRELTERIVKEYVRLGIKDILFNDICYLNSKENQSVDNLQELAVILKREEIPLQFSRKSGRYALGQIMNGSNRIKHFEAIEELVQREQIVQSLQWPFGFSYLEQFLHTLSNDPNEQLFFKKLMSYVDNIETLLKTKSARKIFVLMALSSGDPELEAKVPQENLEKWLALGSDQKKKAQLLASPPIEGIQRLLNNKLLMSQQIREILLPSNEPFPFSHQRLIAEILDNNDQELLERFLAVSKPFDPIMVIEYLLSSPKKVDSELLKKMLPPAPWDLSKSKTPLPADFANLDLDVFELLLEEYKINTIKGFNISAIYKRYQDDRLTLTYRESRVTPQLNCVEILYPTGTLCSIDYGTLKQTKAHIDRFHEIEEYRDIECLKKNHMQEYADRILTANAFMDSEIIKEHSLVITTMANKFLVSSVDFDTGESTLRSCPFEKPDCLNITKRLINERLAIFEERKKLLMDKFPNIEISKGGRETQLGIRKFKGTPSISTVVKRLNRDECHTEANKAGFSHVIIPLKTFTFANLIDGNPKGLTFLEIPTENGFLLNLFVLKTQYKSYIINTGERSDWNSYIGEIGRILEAVNGITINFETAKQFKFSNVKSIFHDTIANVDLDFLNQTLRSLKDSKYLNQVIDKTKMSYEQLSSSLEKLVAEIKKGGSFKSLSVEESRKMAIMLSHTVLKLKQSGDKDNLHVFVCELASESTYCEWKTLACVTTGYMAWFKNSDQNTDVFEQLISQAISETIATMMKLVLDPEDKKQAIHIETYFRNKLEQYISLPQALLNDGFKDKYVTGRKDFPQEQILRFFEAFYLPKLLQTFMVKPSENHETLSVLLDAFISLNIENISFQDIEKKYQDDIERKQSELESLDSEQNECLTDPEYIQHQNLIADYGRIPSMIHALINDCETHQNNLKAFDQVDLKKKKICLMPVTEEMKEIQKKLSQCVIDEKEKEIDILKQKQIAMETILEGPIFKNIDEIRAKIKKIKFAIERLTERFAFDKRECVLAYCRQKGWLTEDEYGTDCFTETGVIKYLELMKIICVPGLQ